MQTQALAQAAAKRAAARIKSQSSAANIVNAAERDKARQSILDFTRYTKPDYQVNWHHRILGDALNRFVRGEIKRLVVTMPPRNGKSELVSRRLPSYALGVNPDLRIIACSYSADLASQMNRDVQRIIDDTKYHELFPATTLSGDNVRTLAHGSYLRNSDIFEVVGHRGFYRSAGVGGGIMGLGFDIGIIDDPIKNREEAESLTYREKTWDWYTSTFYTRAEKDAGILLTATRWHGDDLAGRLLALQAEDNTDQWEVINFPAILEQPTNGDPREVGEALWPDKYSLDTLAAIRANVGSYDWSALYQQQPVSSEGGLFKREKLSGKDNDHIIDVMPSNVVKRVRFWDLAMSSKTTADYNVGGLMALCADGSIVIEDIDRGQRDWGEVEPHIASVAIKDGPDVEQAIEAVFFQSSAVKALLKRPELHDHRIVGVAVDKDKYTRALPFAARVEAGMVYVLRRSWTQGFIDELCSFPLGRNDDQVDICSGGYERLGAQRKPLTVEVVDYLGGKRAG
jgi:predicted phage terminase large subunit-like protein